MSKIEIINRALLKLGEPPVSSITDAAFGKSYEMIYDDVLKLLLSSYPWRFAVTRVRAARKEEKYGEQFLYQLPTDCLLILKIFGRSYGNVNDIHYDMLSAYTMVGQCIAVNDDGGVDLEYVRFVDNDTVFPSLFREALAAKIAAELSMRLKHSINFKQVFDSEFYNLIRQAELNNEIMKDVEMLPDSSWVAVRHSW